MPDYIKPKGYQMDNFDFSRLVKSAEIIYLKYERNGNDEWNPCGTMRKEATYEFYVFVDGVIHMLVYKNHRRTHDEVKEQLIKRYSYWAKKSNPNIKIEIVPG